MQKMKRGYSEATVVCWIVLLVALIVAVARSEEYKTNLPATVTSQIVTNVVTGDNQRGCGTCEMLRVAAGTGFIPAIHHPWHDAEPWHAADERWEITNISSNVTVRAQWGGKTLVHSEDTILSSTTNRWKLAQEWKKE